MSLLIPAIETHEATLGRTPYSVAADAGVYSNKSEARAKAKCLKRVCHSQSRDQRARRAKAGRRSAGSATVTVTLGISISPLRSFWMARIQCVQTFAASGVVL